MKHEILFRGKRIDNGEWVYGYPFMDTAPCSLKAVGKCVCKHDGSYAEIFAWEDEFHEYNSFEVDPATVGEYTGLTDKNGVKIFEGDIVCTVYDGIENVFVVVWDNDELDFKATNGKENYGLGGFQYMPCCEEVKILGNVHDNPELLEVDALKKCCRTCEYWAEKYNKCEHPYQLADKAEAYMAPPDKVCELYESAAE